MEKTEIPLDREARITLLKWLKMGFIDIGELDELHSKAASEKVSAMTMEEKKARIKEIYESIMRCEE